MAGRSEAPQPRGVSPRTLKCRASLEATFAASGESPIANLTLVVHNWGADQARIRIDGKPVAAGKDLRLGHNDTMDGTDLIVWMRREATRPVKIALEPVP